VGAGGVVVTGRHYLASDEISLTRAVRGVPRVNPTGAAYAASGMWRAIGRASHTLCLAVSPMGRPSYM